MLIDGVMLLWFVLTALSVAFVAIDIRSTPEHPVMKWAFVLFTLYSGPFGAFLYVLGCREPLPGLHEQYVAARWRQALGSTMHCVAGDGIGILVGAVIGALVACPWPPTSSSNMCSASPLAGPSSRRCSCARCSAPIARSLKGTFTSELLSMNCLMGGMMPVAAIAFAARRRSRSVAAAVLVPHVAGADGGRRLAYPMNWWLVAHHLKHGMMTVRPKGEQSAMPGMEMAMEEKMELAASSGRRSIRRPRRFGSWRRSRSRCLPSARSSRSPSAATEGGSG